ncbi:hypothetical protein CYANOKiyG1_64330 [Okeania sp. KiyG1]|nr:hypothetical protein CYANOKiyG1_64330 [Okeania sp. KiyG1]
MAQSWSGVTLPDWFRPREWQEEAFKIYQQKCIGGDEANFLLQACPGAGKTHFICAVIYVLQKLNLIDWAIICVPGDHLRTQFARDAMDWDLDLFGTTKLCVVDDYHGEVVTYPQLDNGKSTYKQRIHKFHGRVLIIGDEIHHLSDENSWGEGFTFAFSEAKYRLFTTGTPFRSDNAEIVGKWITYEVTNRGDRECSLDYRYGYDSAVKDGVVRPVVFPEYDGRFEYWKGDKIYQQSFEEAETHLEQSYCLQTALSIEGEWIKDIIREADNKLLEIRENTNHKNAAGLIVCQPRKGKDGAPYARKVCQLLKKLTGDKSVLVTYEDEKASRLIEEFAVGDENSPRWIVAIKKVSEGVSIKRLRVCVYATNILTRMFFEQVVGRITRVIPNINNQMAYMYIPRHRTLEMYALDFKKAVAHIIQDMEEAEQLKSNNGNGKENESNSGLFLPAASTAELEGHIFDGEQHERKLIEKAKKIKEKHGFLGTDEVLIIKIMRELKNEVMSETQREAEEKEIAKQKQEETIKRTKYERVEAFKKMQKKQTAWLARLELGFDNKKLTKAENQKLVDRIKLINKRAARKFGSYNAQATEEIIKKKNQWLEEQIKEVQNRIRADKFEYNEEEYRLYGEEEI